MALFHCLVMKTMNSHLLEETQHAEMVLQFSLELWRSVENSTPPASLAVFWI